MVIKATVFYPNEKVVYQRGQMVGDSWKIFNISDEGSNLIIKMINIKDKATAKTVRYREFVTFGVPYEVDNYTEGNMRKDYVVKAVKVDDVGTFEHYKAVEKKIPMPKTLKKIK